MNPDKNICNSHEKSRTWQREFLMERLRTYGTQNKSFLEISKAMRMSMLEKRYSLDSVEKLNLQKCLDNMQYCIRITTKQGLIERLDSLSRQLGLKFMEDVSRLFIYSDMFFLEIILDPNSGKLKDVKVHHDCKIEQQSCSELVSCLLNGDFADFTYQLEGLSSIYQLNAEPKIKSKAFVALQAMELDLYNIYKYATTSHDIRELLASSPVGIILKRRGGHPMKIIYFIHPYDALKEESSSLSHLTYDLISKEKVGMSVSVNIKASSANKLQILPTVSFAKDSNIPIYSSFNQNNSILLPATFVLKLKKPIPICDSFRHLLGLSTDFKSENLINLTVDIASQQSVKTINKGFFVNLPDQSHCYFFNENKKLTGFVLKNIPYTEPSQVPKIISTLKHQALFYSLVSSCIRLGKKQFSYESTTILEVSILSIYKILVSLQHPYDESMVSVEFDLKNFGRINVQIHSSQSSNEFICKKLAKIVQLCLSIPITIRYLLKLWNHEQTNIFEVNDDENVFAGTGSILKDYSSSQGRNTENLLSMDTQNKLNKNNSSTILDGNNIFTRENLKKSLHLIDNSVNFDVLGNEIETSDISSINIKLVSDYISSGKITNSLQTRKAIKETSNQPGLIDIDNNEGEKPYKICYTKENLIQNLRGENTFDKMNVFKHQNK